MTFLLLRLQIQRDRPFRNCATETHRNRASGISAKKCSTIRTGQVGLHPKRLNAIARPF